MCANDVVIESTNLAVQPTALSMEISTNEALKKMQELQGFVNQVMIKGADYGVIPGTGERPALYKSGAEKMCEVYGLAPIIEIVDKTEDWSKPLFNYTIKCKLVSKRYGFVAAEGIGNCNSMESKFRWRWVWENQVPAGIDKKTLQYTETNKGNRRYRIENDDVYSLINTILKMAKKRALVDAALSATRSSGIFTQDVEDFIEYDFTEKEPEHVNKSKAQYTTSKQNTKQQPKSKAEFVNKKEESKPQDTKNEQNNKPNKDNKDNDWIEEAKAIASETGMTEAMLDKFVHGVFKKDLNELTGTEISNLITQLEERKKK